MTLSQTNSASASAIGQEQSYLDMLYRLLDEARDRADRGLTQTLGSGGAGGTSRPGSSAISPRPEQSRRLAQLNAVEHGLCFGRIDLADEATGGHRGVVPPGGSRASEPTPDRAGTLYIGRIGLRDDEHEPRLIDWRAPAAHPFYAATPSDPNGLIAPPPHLHQEPHGHRGRRTRSSTWTGCRAGPPDPVRRGHADREHHQPSHRPDERRGGDHTVRAGPGHPLRAAGRAGRAGRPGHRQDRRGAAPGRVPALHPPAHARAPRRARHRAERQPSSATSARSCRPSARPTWCSARSPSSSPESRPRPTTIRKPPWSRATSRW